MTAAGVDPPRVRMVEAAGRLLRTRGLAATSVRDVVDAAAAPWGSVRHYFPGGKDQLVVEALQLGRVRTSAAIRGCFDATRSPTGAVSRFFDGAIALLVDSDYALGCPVATVAAETAGRDDVVARECRTALADWQQEFASGFAAGGIPARRATHLAAVVLQQYEGAVLLSRVYRTPDPLRAAARTVKELLVGDRAARAADPEEQ